MFDKDSVIVKVWVSLIKGGQYVLEKVPNLSNLKEVVTQIINDTKA